MKKALKKLLALTAVTATCLSSVLSVSAIGGPIFDLENKDYQNYVTTNAIKHYGEATPRNDEICKLLSFKSSEEVKNLYGSIYDKIFINEKNVIESKRQLFEFGNDTSRHFQRGFIYWENNVANYKELTYNEEDLKAFIAENNYKIDEVKYSYKYDDYLKSYKVHVILDHSEDITPDEVVDIAIALNEKYGLKPYYIVDVTSVSFTETVSVPTITGDLDLNNEQGIADIVALTKYNTSAELFPITDATALANADINQDGTIDAIDTSLLIEIMLGTFESAV